MKIQIVNDRKTEKAFIGFPKRIYKNDPNYVAPFDKDIKAAFDPKQNIHFNNGNAARWLLYDSNEKVIGRIAAFYEKNKAEADYVRSGGCGFFECIDNQEAANKLFDTAAEWLKKEGFEAITGPINFGENESNWGCLVYGFEPQGYGMAYNFPYYQKLFENYGFQLYYRQFSFHIDLDKPFPERFWKIAEWINKRPNYSYEHFDYNQAKKFVNDTVKVYNEAWPLLKDDYTPMDPDSIYELLEKAKPIMDPKLCWFAYHKGEPIAFFTFLPDANQIFRHLNGKLHLWNKIKFLILKKQKVMTRMRGNAAGVSPKFQNSGVESGIMYQLKQVVEQYPHYKQVELSWVGDFNPKMLSLYKNTGAYHAKTHITYRYMINKDIPFQRFMPERLDPEKLPEGVL
ncbi:GNAT family N-acetyltransferase [Bacteroidota bacterium]